MEFAITAPLHFTKCIDANGAAAATNYNNFIGTFLMGSTGSLIPATILCTLHAEWQYTRETMCEIVHIIDATENQYIDIHYIYVVP